MVKIRPIYISAIMVFLFLSFSCKKETKSFVLSKFISTVETKEATKISAKDLKNYSPPPPVNKGNIFKAPKNWYTQLVIVLDSTDKVYLYQTEVIPKQDILNNSHGMNSDTTKYSNYIGLQPEYLISFKSNEFANFIKDNHDIFELDTIRNDSTLRIITLASNQDTIKNIAFYDLQELVSMYTVGTKSSDQLIPINKNRNTIYNICIVRKTTEEENAVIFHKRRKFNYNPETINWSKDFINGQYKPFTNEYDSLEKNMVTKVRAIAGIKKISKIFRWID